MMDAAHSDHLTGVYTDPDTFVRELGDHLAFAPTPEQLAEQVRNALRAILEHTHLLGAGASQHLIDLAVLRLAQAVDPLQRHLKSEIDGSEVEVGLCCAAAVIRSLGASAVAPDDTSEFDIAQWLDSVAHFANAMTNAFLIQRMEARMRAHGRRGTLERLRPAATTSTMH